MTATRSRGRPRLTPDGVRPLHGSVFAQHLDFIDRVMSDFDMNKSEVLRSMIEHAMRSGWPYGEANSDAGQEPGSDA